MLSFYRTGASPDLCNKAHKGEHELLTPMHMLAESKTFDTTLSLPAHQAPGAVFPARFKPRLRTLFFTQAPNILYNKSNIVQMIQNDIE